MKLLRMTPLPCLVLAVALPASAGVIIENAKNYVGLLVTADTSFEGTFVDFGPSVLDSAIAAPLSLPHPSFRNTVSAVSTLVPSSTEHLKDQAKGTVEFDFNPGEVGVEDTFSVSFFGFASALSAKASDGSPAAARVSLFGRALFFLDSPGAVPGAVVGSLAIDALRPARSFESFLLAVEDNGATVAVFGPGDPDGTVPLYAGHGYQIDAKYQMLVPHGEDPPFTLGMGGSLVPAIPEPETYAMLLAGLGLIGAIARRRRARTTATAPSM